MSALAAITYSAAGQDTSALHAMTILQVHQAKALKEMHEGSTNPRLMQQFETPLSCARRLLSYWQRMPVPPAEMKQRFYSP